MAYMAAWRDNKQAYASGREATVATELDIFMRAKLWRLTDCKASSSDPGHAYFLDFRGWHLEGDGGVFVMQAWSCAARRRFCGASHRVARTVASWHDRWRTTTYIFALKMHRVCGWVWGSWSRGLAQRDWNELFARAFVCVMLTECIVYTKCITDK